MKALFFLRHYNDVDHIAPIIHKWVEAGHRCDVVFIGGAHFRDDYRIAYLASLPAVRLAHIDEVLGRGELFRMRVQMMTLTGKLPGRAGRLLAALLTGIQSPAQRIGLWRRTAQHLLDRSFAGENGGVVVFDWITRNTAIAVEWVEQLVGSARNRGLGAVSLPHGDSPHANKLIRRNELRPTSDTTYEAAKMFDRVVVPNELCATRFRPFIADGVIAVLGSPRYCDEWLNKLTEILPPSPLPRQDGRLTVVMFLRKRNFTSFWEEIGLVSRMLADFDGVELIIKQHTRGGWKQPLAIDFGLRRKTNVRIVGDAIHSAHLLAWADVVIDLATSVSFEAVKNRKPVLAADYLHAGLSTVARYLPETALHCRDDVHRQIQRFLSQGCDGFYDEQHRQDFLNEMIDVGGPDVLSRYVALLESVCRCAPASGAD
jgi:hypothetical protein